MPIETFPGATPRFVPAVRAVSAEHAARARVLVFDGAALIVREDPLRLSDAPIDSEAPHAIGDLDGEPLLVAQLRGPLPAGHRAVDLRALSTSLPTDEWAAAAYGAQVLHWDRTNRFCGACGVETSAAPDPSKRARVCPRCGHEAYPRVAPCTITAIHDGSRLLLVRAPHFPVGRFGLVAGFVEPGESLEDCVRREAREEVGIELRSVEYLASQPWPFPHQLMVGFVASAEPQEPRLLDGELAEAAWFAPDALPKLPPRLSIARAIIEHVAASIAR